jgi:hypothetical protein
VAHPAPALGALGQVKGTVDEGDPPVPEVEQVAGGELSAPGVVD